MLSQHLGQFYEKIRVNKKESDDIDAWINQVRVDLKKNIIPSKQQNRDINNCEIYAYCTYILAMHSGSVRYSL